MKFTGKLLQEAFNVVTRYELPVDREDLEQVDNLRYTWQQLIARAMETNCLLLSLQPHFSNDLCHNLECFCRDTVQYCHDYHTSGPMMPGLTPREASDRLLLFQVGFMFVNTSVNIFFNMKTRCKIAPVLDYTHIWE